MRAHSKNTISSALRLAYALIRIPQLFGALYLVPLLLSMVLVLLQLGATAIFVVKFDRTSYSASSAKLQNSEVLGNSGKKQYDELIRRLLFQNDQPPPKPRVCRWISQLKDGQLRELPPNAECAPRRLDVAFITEDPQSPNVDAILNIFSGNAFALHVCKSCHPDIIIHSTGTEIRTEALSVWGLLLINLARLDPSAPDQIDAIRAKGIARGSELGSVYLHAHGLKQPLSIDDSVYSLALVFNFASLVTISLWLAITSHKKVLSYFARSGALLPLVAATKPRSFYYTLWLLTVARVGTFLCASLPLTFYAIHLFFSNDEAAARRLSMSNPITLDSLAWGIAMGLGFACAAVIASISELKQRSSPLMALILYVPLGISLLGGTIWLCTFALDSDFCGLLRNIIVSTPILGMAPLLLAPLFQPPTLTLLIHAAASLIFTVSLAAKNSTWFTHHMEEL